jgi:predicted RNA polymerase sigma factor
VRSPTSPLIPARDDSLILLFLCCHPSLTSASAIALTLRAVGGLSTAEIASAFLVPEATMAQRISRAKQRIKESNVPFAMPPRGPMRTQGLRSVLHTLYLVFNEGYASSRGDDLLRIDLSSEAIRLARLLHEELPHDREVGGLLALMLLTDARRPARTGPHGELIPLAEQDRSRWNRSQISEGLRLVVATRGSEPLGEYQLQAAIAGTHDEAVRVADTDWPRLRALYEMLEARTHNPMVTLNRAIAVAMVDGPAAGLVLLSTLDDPLKGHYRLDSARAHLYEMAGDRDKAIGHFRAAARSTSSGPERDYLTRQAARLAHGAEED